MERSVIADGLMCAPEYGSNKAEHSACRKMSVEVGSKNQTPSDLTPPTGFDL